MNERNEMKWRERISEENNNNNKSVSQKIFKLMDQWKQSVAAAAIRLFVTMNVFFIERVQHRSTIIAVSISGWKVSGQAMFNYWSDSWNGQNAINASIIQITCYMSTCLMLTCDHHITNFTIENLIAKITDTEIHTTLHTSTSNAL